MLEQELKRRREKVEKFAARMQEMVARKASKGNVVELQIVPGDG
jgi:hypothetical protein